MIHGSQTIQIERRSQAGTDQWGNPVWEKTVIGIDGTLIAWGGTSTFFGKDRVLISSSITAYLPHGTDVLDGDVFIVHGERYRKNGESQDWTTPPGFALSTGVVVNLDKAEG